MDTASVLERRKVTGSRGQARGGAQTPSPWWQGKREGWGQRQRVALFGAAQKKEFSFLNKAGHQLGHEERLWDQQSFEIRGEAMNTKKQ